MATVRSLYPAMQAYAEWHQKDPTEVIETIPFIPPPRVYAVGTARNILYNSDKWEDDGNFHEYIHRFDSHPTIYTESGDGDDHFQTQELLGLKQLRGQVALPQLAEVLHVGYFDLDGNKRKIKFVSYQPILLCTTDMLTLVILAEEGLVFINGGEMEVTKFGIVR